MKIQPEKIKNKLFKNTVIICMQERNKKAVGIWIGQANLVDKSTHDLTKTGCFISLFLSHIIQNINQNYRRWHKNSD